MRQIEAYFQLPAWISYWWRETWNPLREENFRNQHGALHGKERRFPHFADQNKTLKFIFLNLYRERVDLLRSWWKESMVGILAVSTAEQQGFSIIKRRLIVGNRNTQSLALWRSIKSPSRGNYKLFICQPFVFDLLAQTSPATHSKSRGNRACMSLRILVRNCFFIVLQHTKRTLFLYQDLE